MNKEYKNLLQGLGVGAVLHKTRQGFVDTEEIENKLVLECERRFAEVHGVPVGWVATGVSNGTDAIILALEALGIGFGDEVLVPGLTWQATWGAVLDVNAVPIGVDIDPRTLTMDPDAVEALLADRVRRGVRLPKAMIVVHLYGRAANMDRFVAIAKRYKVLLLEDCAHAHGASWNGRALGTFGVIGTFSTQRTKPLAGVKRPDDTRWACPTGSEGGFMLTGVPLLDQRLRALVSCGRKVDTSLIDPNAAVDDLTAYWRDQVDELDLVAYPLQSGNNRLPASVAERLLDQLARFADEHRQRAAAISDAEALLRNIDGIVLCDHQPQLTSPVAHILAFRYRKDAFAGMTIDRFRYVLSALLDNYLVDRTYHPLGGGEPGYQSPVYSPHSKPRYHLSEDHWQAIDASQWDLPETHKAYQEVVCIENTALGETGFAPALASALTWMHDNAQHITNTTN
jgi:L-glutamine:2-deoxy-scyllo-inosose/3-amino-2,3-dideoxy-scyllo-inosose aminotransferase